MSHPGPPLSTGGGVGPMGGLGGGPHASMSNSMSSGPHNGPQMSNSLSGGHPHGHGSMGGLPPPHGHPHHPNMGPPPHSGQQQNINHPLRMGQSAAGLNQPMGAQHSSQPMGSQHSSQPMGAQHSSQPMGAQHSSQPMGGQGQMGMGPGRDPTMPSLTPASSSTEGELPMNVLETRKCCFKNI